MAPAPSKIVHFSHFFIHVYTLDRNMTEYCQILDLGLDGVFSDHVDVPYDAKYNTGCPERTVLDEAQCR